MIVAVISAIERDSNSDLCDADVVLLSLSYHANLELAVMWVYDEPVNSGYINMI